MIEENVFTHFGNWWAVLIWIAIYGLFILFAPFYKKSSIKPTGAYLAFVVAFAIEMFGVPFSMFAIGALFGIWLPEGVFWGHTLGSYIGDMGSWIGAIVSLSGVALVLMGWKKIHKNYWVKETGEGELVTDGIYKYVRHPQYTGFFMIPLGIMIGWATIPLIVLYLILLVMYYKLAKKEENDMIDEFGPEYEEYKNKTKMFIPYLV
jgi:protein-S-isoprenylcysteine O-methyltransferase Ste14